MACGGGAAYLWVAAACSIGSLFYVLSKAGVVFGVAVDGAAGLELHGKGQLLALAYRASSREKRRLHVVYRINIEVVSPCPSSPPCPSSFALTTMAMASFSAAVSVTHAKPKINFTL